MTLIVIGCDPGPCTGLAVLRYPGNPAVFQCTADSAEWLVRALLEPWPFPGAQPARILLAGEAFQAGRGPGARMRTGDVTRDLIAVLGRLGEWHWRAAGLVKPWATDKRLEKAGLLGMCRGMPHAADAMRHALYAAVHDGGIPDPLSEGKDHERG